MRVFLDSCIVIYAVEPAPAHGKKVLALLESMKGTAFCVSDLVRLECRVGPMRRKDTKLLAEFDRYFTTTAVLPLRSEAIDLATDFRANYGLKTVDALHLATASFHAYDEFWTNDDRFSKVASLLRVRKVP